MRMLWFEMNEKEHLCLVEGIASCNTVAANHRSAEKDNEQRYGAINIKWFDYNFREMITAGTLLSVI
jgi:hypothetical protein